MQNAEHRFHLKNISSEKGGGYYSELVKYLSLLSNLVPLLPLPIIFIKCRRSRILLVSFFFELWDFMIYRLVDKTIEILLLQPLGCCMRPQVVKNKKTFDIW